MQLVSVLRVRSLNREVALILRKVSSFVSAVAIVSSSRAKFCFGQDPLGKKPSNFPPPSLPPTETNSFVDISAANHVHTRIEVS